MKVRLTITKEAADFYKSSMPLKTGETVTLFVRVGGVGSGGFSAGVTRGKPETDYRTVVQEDITFCISDDDSWYFDGMTIDYNSDYNEVTFINDSIGDVTNPK